MDSYDAYESLYECQMADIHFYGPVIGNGLVAIRLHGERYPTRWLSNHETLTRVFQNLAEYFRVTIEDMPVNSEMDLLEVSEELEIAQSVISRLWQRIQDDGNVSRCYSSTGRPQVTTPNEDRYIFGSYCQKKKTEHSIRPVSLALFSYRFSLQSDSRRTLIWRAPGTRCHQENTIERHRYGGAGWLFWGGIILGSRTDLHVQSVTMTGHIYRDVILEQHVRLFRGRHGC
ncbi:uncharacterized protein TNCV_4486101 [Trichonephila clavipes]|nr:uncharacterized protein TNCV_4486101 [Trichonephila clavipes]